MDQKEKQIEEMDLAVLSCFRNKHYAEDISLESGIVASAINRVLPILVSVKNGDYRKQSEGEWIRRTPHSEAECNQCGRCPKLVFGMLPDYCPHCGAKMKGKQYGNKA